MAITPISPVRMQSRPSINFGTNNKARDNKPQHTASNVDLKTLPLAALFTLLPLSAANADLPYSPVADPNVSAMVSNPETDNVSTYVITPKTHEAEQTEAPYGYKGIAGETIKLDYKCKVNNENCHLLFTSLESNAGNNFVQFAYLVFENQKVPNEDMATPPAIAKINFPGDIGQDKEFCGVLLEEDIIKNDRYRGSKVKEVRLDDDTANILIRFFAGKTAYANKTQIKIESVKTSSLRPERIYE